MHATTAPKPIATFFPYPGAGAGVGYPQSELAPPFPQVVCKNCVPFILLFIVHCKVEFDKI